MKREYVVYIETKDETHKPIRVDSWKCEEAGQAIAKAMKLPSVKKIMGSQQTGQLRLVARAV